MIAVDIFADVIDIDDKNRERLHRMGRASAAAYRMAAGKVVEPMLFVDAALSVLDAINSFLQHVEAREVTQQLKIESQRLQTMLSELNKQLSVDEAVDSERYAARLRKVREHLNVQRVQVEMNVQRFSSLARQVKTLGEIITLQRNYMSPRSIVLLAMEAQYYRLVDSQLQFALNMIDE